MGALESKRDVRVCDPDARLGLWVQYNAYRHA